MKLRFLIDGKLRRWVRISVRTGVFFSGSVRITLVILISAVSSRWPTTTVCLLALQLSLPWRRTPAPTHLVGQLSLPWRRLPNLDIQINSYLDFLAFYQLSIGFY